MSNAALIMSLHLESDDKSLCHIRMQTGGELEPKLWPEFIINEF